MEKIVIKIGSSSIVNPETNSMFTERMESIAEDVAWLINRKNIKVILMSSGALAWGRECIEQSDIDESKLQKKAVKENQQVAGAVGQIGIAAAWANAFTKQNLAIGQLLLDPASASNSIVKNTIESMLDAGIVPYINENIPTMKEYDNDGLSANVAQQINCDTLILLSDVDGVYTANPKTDASAQLIPQIDDIDQAITNFAGDSSTQMGTGGMVTKLLAAKKMSQLNVNTIIATGERLNPLRAVIDTNSGTIVKAK